MRQSAEAPIVLSGVKVIQTGESQPDLTVRQREVSPLLSPKCKYPTMFGGCEQPAWSTIRMSFGKHVRQLRKAKGLTLRGLASLVGVGFTYLSRVETGNMTCGEYPSEALIHRLAETLDADEDELLLLAKKIPDRIRRRVLERPEAFRKIADLDDLALDRVLKEFGGWPARKPRREG